MSDPTRRLDITEEARAVLALRFACQTPEKMRWTAPFEHMHECRGCGGCCGFGGPMSTMTEGLFTVAKPAQLDLFGLPETET